MLIGGGSRWLPSRDDAPVAGRRRASDASESHLKKDRLEFADRPLAGESIAPPQRTRLVRIDVGGVVHDHPPVTGLRTRRPGSAPRVEVRLELGRTDREEQSHNPVEKGETPWVPAADTDVHVGE